METYCSGVEKGRNVTIWPARKGRPIVSGSRKFFKWFHSHLGAIGEGHRSFCLLLGTRLKWSKGFVQSEGGKAKKRGLCLLKTLESQLCWLAPCEMGGLLESMSLRPAWVT